MRYVMVFVLLLAGVLWAESTGKFEYQLWQFRQCTPEYADVNVTPCFRKEPRIFPTLDAVLRFLNGDDARYVDTTMRVDQVEVLQCKTLILIPEITERTYTVPAKQQTEKVYKWVKPSE